MLTVTTLNGATTAPITDYKDDEMYEEVLGDFTLSFASFFTPENVGHALLTEESIVEADGHKFRIKQVTTTHHTKRVTAVHTYFDNADKRKYDIYGGTRTLNEFLTYTLAGTGWTYVNVDITGSAFIPNYGNDNVVTLIDALCGAFNCEFKINANNTLTFSKSIGPNRDAVYRFKSNIRGLQHDVDTTKLKTVIRGTGGNGLNVTYRSPNASVFGDKEAEPIYDEDIATSSEMIARLRQEITEDPEVTIEVDTIELTEKELGERVWLIYEPLGIEFQTRILSKTTRTPRYLSTVVIGNTLGKSGTKDFADVNIDIDENAKQFRSRIDQTNDRITLEVEEVGASIAAVNVRADNITFSVTQLNGRVGNNESQLSIQAGQIQSRVTYSDYNGQTVTSMITQDPYSISLLAQNLNLQGLVTFTNLNTAGAAIIDGGNIYGNSFQVGRGSGSTLTMTAIQGSHVLQSNDANGFRIGSNGSMGLSASGAMGVYVPNSNLVAQAGFRVTGGVVDIQVPAYINNALIATQTYVGTRIAQLETDIKVWANGRFALK